MTNTEKDIIVDNKLMLDPGEKAMINVIFPDMEIKNVEVTMPERDYSEEELNALYEECLGKVVGELLGNNESIDNVTQDLRLFTSIRGYPFGFEWVSGSPEIITSKGQLIAKDAFVVTLQCTVLYKQFNKTFSLTVSGVPSDEAIKAYYQRYSSHIFEDKNTDRDIYLPETVDEKPVEFKPAKSKYKPVILLIGLAGSILVVLASYKDKEREAGNRREMIISEYPVVLEKMTLYLAAGMTMRNIWKKIVDDAVKNGKGKHPLYEEMQKTVYEENSGMSEPVAYSRFGKRVDDVRINRFCSLLIQNQKRGSTNLEKLLMEEARNENIRKIEHLKEKGEKAGTKLLLPMMLLLIVVMVIIMVPAFMNL